MSGRCLLFVQVVDKGDALIVLYKYLTKKWAFLEAPQEFTASRSLCLNTESAMGAFSDTWFPVLETLGPLVFSSAEGLNKLSLFAVNEEGFVSILNSRFQVGESAYKDKPGELFSICGDIPADGLPTIVRLEAIHFANNSSCVGELTLEFESILAWLTSSLLRDFEENSHQPVVEGEDDGVHLIKSRGLAFVSCATAETAID